jgi:hypothetical protein
MRLVVIATIATTAVVIDIEREIFLHDGVES